MIPTFDIEKVKNHNQLYDYSCIPSAVEIILKLTGKVDSNFYELQHEWKNKANGTFGQFNNRILHGLQFFHKFNDKDRDNTFPLLELFNFISTELRNDRYIIVSLPWPRRWHMAVIYDEQDKEFLAITKVREGFTCKTANIWKVTTMIRGVKGTDILIYKDISPIN